MKTTKKTASQKYRAKIKKARSEADEAWGKLILTLHPICEFCEKKKSTDPHHFVPKSQSNILRYDPKNGIGLCHAHHFLHHLGDPFIQQKIIEKRGKKWFEYIKSKRHEIMKKNINIEWYKNKTKILNDKLKKIQK